MAKRILYPVPQGGRRKRCACGAQIVFVKIKKAGGGHGFSWMPLSLRTSVVVNRVEHAEPHFGDCHVHSSKMAEEQAERKRVKLIRTRGIGPTDTQF